jgi:hypothetical protein
MKARYKKTHCETVVLGFNLHSVNEVVTEDDSAFIFDLDVWLTQKSEWEDMRQAFADHDLITDNFNTFFFEPQNEEDRQRGYAI